MSTPTDRELLERRLRAAADTRPARPMPADAWREHQDRLAADGRRRSGVHRRLLAAAAGLALVAGLVTATALLDDGPGPDTAGPAQGPGGDPWDPGNILGEPVLAETLILGGQPTRHELVLTDTTGDGPDLCDRYTSGDGSSGAGGCTARNPNADNWGVAFDWLMGTEGGGDIRGVTAGVDARVTSVDIWTSDGTRVPADLHPTGWDGTRMFALTVPADGPVPQRLVAYGRDGNVLQASALSGPLGDDWVAPTRSFCEGPSTGRWTSPPTRSVDEVSVSWSPTDALVTTRGHAPACLDSLRASALAGWTRIGNRLVVLVAPEATLVQVMDGEELVAFDEATAGDGSPLRVVVFTGLDDTVLQDAVLLVRGPVNEELDRAFVNQPDSP